MGFIAVLAMQLVAINRGSGFALHLYISNKGTCRQTALYFMSTQQDIAGFLRGWTNTHDDALSVRIVHVHLAILQAIEGEIAIIRATPAPIDMEEFTIIAIKVEAVTIVALGIMATIGNGTSFTQFIQDEFSPIVVIPPEVVT